MLASGDEHVQRRVLRSSPWVDAHTNIEHQLRAVVRVDRVGGAVVDDEPATLRDPPLTFGSAAQRETQTVTDELGFREHGLTRQNRHPRGQNLATLLTPLLDPEVPLRISGMITPPFLVPSQCGVVPPDLLPVRVAAHPLSVRDFLSTDNNRF